MHYLNCAFYRMFMSFSINQNLRNKKLASTGKKLLHTKLVVQFKKHAEIHILSRKSHAHNQRERVLGRDLTE